MNGLTLVTVPIGNFDDITIRSRLNLQRANTIVAEDTRVVKQLLQALEISYSDKNILSFHEHSTPAALGKILSLMQTEQVVYVSDAGSPALSDPALPLVKLCLENGLELQSAPGVSSVIAAIELSALPCTPFHFHGFLARDNSKRQEFAQTVSEHYGLHIFFEGVSRVEKVLDELTRNFSAWQFCVCRELTKSYQSVYRFQGSDWESLKTDVVFKGEFVILIYNPEKKAPARSADLVEIAQNVMKSGARPKLLAKLLAPILGITVKEAYASLEEKRAIK